MSARPIYDLTIIGGGIVGLATARLLSIRHPKLRLCVIEKDKELASHQSKRNSGVVHQGIYYKKGSLKSKFCIEGAQLVKEYCQAKGLPYKQCGKLIVANKKEELDELQRLFANAKDNQIAGVELWSGDKVRDLQPECTNALEAIWCPNTAIVNWQQVAQSYANDFVQNGGHIITEFVAYKLEPGASDGSVVVEAVKYEDAQASKLASLKRNLKPPPPKTNPTSIETKALVNCAGLYSDYFARLTGNNEHPKVVPFRGRYYLMGDKLASSIKTNIYPVPDPKLPFLGVHITPRVDGSVLVGPTAMLSLGYEKYSDEDRLKYMEVYHILFRSGLRKILLKKDFLRASLKELWNLSSKESFAKDVQQFIPKLKPEDLVDTNFAGNRAQTMSMDGEFVDDFLFETGFYPDFNRVLHVRNCPSPAATSSLKIADRVVNLLEGRLI